MPGSGFRRVQVLPPHHARRRAEGAVSTVRSASSYIGGVMAPDLEQALREAMAIAARRRGARERLRRALDAGDIPALIESARELLGAEDEEVGDRSSASQ
jgi:hypothetical protein